MTTFRTLKRLPRRCADWVEVRCAVFLGASGSAPYVPWQDLADTVQTWRDKRLFELFFFMRKPPGLRLRFYGRDLSARFEPELLEWLDRMERENNIRSFRFSVYEPEYFRFGGSLGMGIAHEFFDRDCRAVLGYETLPTVGRESLPRDLASLFAINDLFAQSLEDGAEIWDVWQRLGRLVKSSSLNGPSKSACNRARDMLTLKPAFKRKLPTPTAEWLQTVSEYNDQIAGRLRAAASGGRLGLGLRAWLAAACVFHWNRFGLTNSDLAIMVVMMERLL